MRYAEFEVSPVGESGGSVQRRSRNADLMIEPYVGSEAQIGEASVIHSDALF